MVSVPRGLSLGLSLLLISGGLFPVNLPAEAADALRSTLEGSAQAGLEQALNPRAAGLEEFSPAVYDYGPVEYRLPEILIESDRYRSYYGRISFQQCMALQDWLEKTPLVNRPESPFDVVFTEFNPNTPGDPILLFHAKGSQDIREGIVLTEIVKNFVDALVRAAEDSADHQARGQLIVSLSRRGNTWTLELKDNAFGIPDAKFRELFTRDSPSGVRKNIQIYLGGRGISISRGYYGNEFLRMHGGRIEIETCDALGTPVRKLKFTPKSGAIPASPDEVEFSQGERLAETTGTTIRWIFNEAGLKATGLEEESTGTPESIPVLNRMPRVEWESLVLDLNQWLGHYGQIVNMTKSYGLASFQARVVERTDEHITIGVWAEEDWVKEQQKLHLNLAHQLSWDIKYRYRGRGVLHIFGNFYRDESGQVTFLMEAVQLLAGVMRLQAPEELEVRRFVIEAVGEWGIDRQIPVCLVRPEVIRQVREQPLKERTIKLNYDRPVDRDMWGTKKLIVRNSFYVMPEVPFPWFVYKGKKNADVGSGLEEQPLPQPGPERLTAEWRSGRINSEIMDRLQELGSRLFFWRGPSSGLEELNVPSILSAGSSEVLVSWTRMDDQPDSSTMGSISLVADQFGIPQMVRSWKIGEEIPADLPPVQSLVVAQPGLLPADVTFAFLSMGWKVEEPSDFSGYIQREAQKWPGPLFVIAGTGLEEAVRSLQGGQVTAVLIDEGMGQLLSPKRLLTYLLQVFMDLPGRIIRLEYLIGSGLEEFWAVSTQL